MMKDIGQHVSYGAPYPLLPSVEVPTSKKPMSKTIKKIQDQSQLQMEVKKLNPGLSLLELHG